jgi:pentafunctional AROM polypeptide
VHQRGWPPSRDAEIAVVRELIETEAKGHTISLGGTVETQAELLKEYAARRGPVVRIAQPLTGVIAYLDTGGSRPAYGAPVRPLICLRI